MSEPQPSSSLLAAAENLQHRIVSLGVPASRLPSEVWNGAAPHIRVVPYWIRHLLEQYSLLGAVLQHHDPRTKFQRLFAFFGIEQYDLFLSPGSVTAPLVDFRLLPFAYESDGNVWVMQGDSDQGEVFLFDNSDWSGNGPPSVGDGLTFAASRLEYLLLTMSISEASYYSLERPRRIMWYRGE